MQKQQMLIYVDNQTVSAPSNMFYQFQLKQGVGISIVSGDYVQIVIPSNTDSIWNQLRQPQCVVTSGATVLSCRIISSKTARISLSAQQGLVISGSISNFINPKSIQGIQNILAALYSKENTLKASAQSLGINSFLPSSLVGSLSSSSNLIGAQNQILFVDIDPWTVVPAQGFIILGIPQYYTGATGDFLISTSQSLTCNSSLAQNVSCAFNQRLMEVTIQYSLISGQDYQSNIQFTISPFNNPVMQTQDGFSLMILDQFQNQVSFLSAFSLGGITQAAKFLQQQFIYVDYANSGSMATHQFVFQSSISFEQGCIIRIVYPQGLKITDQLTQVTGTGFFTPSSNSIQFTTNTANNSIDVIACQQNYGLLNTGVLTLSQVQNQDYQHDIGSFQVYMTQLGDTQFQNIYQRIDSGFTVPKSQQLPPLVNGYLTAGSTLVQTSTSLRFFIAPTKNLNTSSYILINIPDSIQFMDPSCTLSNIIGFYANIVCNRQNQLVNISNLFTSFYNASSGKKLAFNLDDMLLPTGVQPVGNIQLVIYDFILSANQFDQVGILNINNLSTTPGNVLKIADVTTTSITTNDINALYTFHFRIDHSVPIGGYFSIILSNDTYGNGASITNPQTIQNECYMITSKGSQSLQCVSGLTQADLLPYVNISITSNMFGKSGVPKGSSLLIKIQGFTNPRSVDQKNYFSISTLDQIFRVIDQNPTTEQFFIKMSQISYISSIKASVDNQTNGAIANYNFDIVPSQKIISNDIFTIKFPQEIYLNQQLTCNSQDPTMVYLVSCQQTQRQIVQFKIIAINSSHSAGQKISLVVGNVQNSVSLRQTSNFTNMIFYESEYMNMMSVYNGSLFVTNQIIGQLQTQGMSISQSSYNDGEDSLVTIIFNTNNNLPSTAVIVITVPQIMILYIDRVQNCSISLDMAVVSTSYCYFNQKQVIYQNAFQLYPQPFNGTIQVQFLTQNPFNSIYLNRTGYYISIFDDKSLAFPIDQYDKNFLLPSLECFYPCDTCVSTNKNFCLTCLSNILEAPQYLFTPKNLGYQTCIQSCPANEGYTSNGSNPKKCAKCADTCATCAQNNLPGDINICTSCPSNYSFLWINTNTCTSECPEGTFVSNLKQCQNCLNPCLSCSDRLTCTKCNAKSDRAYLSDGQCVEQCPSGFTDIQNECVQCNPPCATCDRGQINSCLTCDNTNNQQFLYGKQCVQKCPVNTTLNSSNICVGCTYGCASCDDQDNTICLICSPGLALLNNTCNAECPEGYIKSADGTTCELRTYPLDNNIIYFPFLEAAAFFIMVTLASYWLTGNKSLVSSSIIAFLGPVEMAANAYQIFYAQQPDKQFKPILYGSIVVLAGGFTVNMVFVFLFMRQQKDTDRLFKRWRRQKWCSSNFILIISALFSMTLYRLIFCQLFRVEFMNIKVSRPIQFVRPILIFTWIKVIVFNIPLIAVSFIGLNALTWGNQCYMTCIECLIISFSSILTMMWETYHRENIILNDENILDVDKIVQLDETDAILQNNYQKIGFKQVIPGKDLNISENSEIKLQKRGAISLSKIKFQLKGQVSLVDLKEAESKRQASPRTLQIRLQNLIRIVDTVKQSQDTGLNNQMDQVFKINYYDMIKPKKYVKQDNSLQKLLEASIDKNIKGKKKDANKYLSDDEKSKDLMSDEGADKASQGEKKFVHLRKSQSLILTKAEYKYDFEEYKQQMIRKESEKELNDQSSVYSKAQSFPQLFMDEKQILIRFQQIIEERQQMKLLAQQNNQATEYDNQIDNVLKSEREPIVAPQLHEQEIQTDQQKNNGIFESLKEGNKDAFIDKLMNQQEQLREQENKKKKIKVRRGRRSFFKNAIDDEDDDSASDKQSLTYFQKFDNGEEAHDLKHGHHGHHGHHIHQKNILSLAMQVEQDHSLTSLYDLELAYEERLKSLVKQSGSPQNYDQSNNLNLSTDVIQQLQNNKGISLSRVSGDLDFTEDDEDNFNFVQNNPNADKKVKKFEIKNVQAWIKDQVKSMNQRNFNENDILGNFERDWAGKIKDRDFILKQNNYRDKDGNLVNKKGYLIDQLTGNVRSRYTFDVVFQYSELIGVGDEKIELPLPYRLERHNFNPHQIMGNFDYYDKSDKPRILKNAENQRMDKNFRMVNQKGWLIDSYKIEKQNVVDNMGQIKFIKEQLDSSGELPNLFNYDGLEYSIKDIIGYFDRDKNSKEIILCKNEKDSSDYSSYDKRGRKVNSKGYLVDKRANIINKQGQIIFKSHELMFNEPPKIFKFTEFSVNWIKGLLDRDVTQNQKHDDEYDLNGNKINTMGYLVDEFDNIIDVFGGNIVFKKEILIQKFNIQEAEIPLVFRSGQLKEAEKDVIELYLQQCHQKAFLRKEARQIMFNSNKEEKEYFQKEQQNYQEKQRKIRFKNQFTMIDIEGNTIDEIKKDDEMSQLLVQDINQVEQEVPGETEKNSKGLQSMIKKTQGGKSLYSGGEKITNNRATSAFVNAREIGSQFKNSSVLQHSGNMNLSQGNLTGISQLYKNNEIQQVKKNQFFNQNNQ